MNRKNAVYPPPLDHPPQFLLEFDFQLQQQERHLQESSTTNTNNNRTRPDVEGACDTLFDSWEDAALQRQQAAADTQFFTFSNTPAISAAHNGIPRGGNTNDVVVLATGTSEEAQSYIVGLLVASIMVMLFFAVWITFLIVFKCCFGPKRVGFLSGKRMKLPPKPTAMEGDGQEEDQGVEVVAPVVMDVAGDDDDNDVDNKNNPTTTTNTNMNDMVVVDTQSVDIDVDEYNNNVGDNKSTMASKRKQTMKYDVSTPEGWNDMYAQKIKQQRIMKVAVFVCCCVVIAMAILMAVKGIESLRGSVDEGQNSINYAGELVNAGAVTVYGIASYLEAFRQDMFTLLTEANQICPVVTNDNGGICANISDPTTCDEALADQVFGSIIAAVAANESAIQQIVDVALNDTQATGVNTVMVNTDIDTNITDEDMDDIDELVADFSNSLLEFNFTNLVSVFADEWPIVNELYTLSDDLSRIYGATNQANDQISTINWVFYVAVVFDLIVGVLALCMIIALILPLPRLLRCLQNRVLFPLFCTFAVLSFIFAIAFLIASLAMSDVCYDSPEAQIRALAEAAIESNGLDSSYIPQYVLFWLSSCKAEPTSPEEDLQILSEVRTWVSELDAIMNEFFVSANEACETPPDQQDFYSSVFDTLSGYLCASIDGLLTLQSALSCQTWMPLYYTVAYNALCYNGTSGVWAIAATQFLTTLMTGFILTFRAVFWPLEIEEGTPQSVDEKYPSSMIVDSIPSNHNNNNSSMTGQKSDEPVQHHSIGHTGNVVDDDDNKDNVVVVEALEKPMD